MALKQRRQKAPKAKPTKRLLRESVEGERISHKATRLYDTKLKALLEPDYIVKFAANGPDSEDYFAAPPPDVRKVSDLPKARFFILGCAPAVRIRQGFLPDDDCQQDWGVAPKNKPETPGRS